jgi:hypothetical protein
MDYRVFQVLKVNELLVKQVLKVLLVNQVSQAHRVCQECLVNVDFQVVMDYLVSRVNEVYQVLQVYQAFPDFLVASDKKVIMDSVDYLDQKGTQVNQV